MTDDPTTQPQPSAPSPSNQEHSAQTPATDPTGGPPPAGSDEEDVAEFAALLADITTLRDADTEVHALDIEQFRKGKR